MATINPDLLVWDAVVLRNLKLKKPLPSDKHRLKKPIELYNAIRNWYASYLTTEIDQDKIFEFDKRFPKSGISNIKKIDLILWQTEKNALKDFSSNFCTDPELSISLIE